MRVFVWKLIVIEQQNECENFLYKKRWKDIPNTPKKNEENLLSITLSL